MSKLTINDIYGQFNIQDYGLDDLILDTIKEYNDYNKSDWSLILSKYFKAFDILYQNVDVFDEGTQARNVDTKIILIIILAITTIYFSTNFLIKNNVFDLYENKYEENYKVASLLFTKYNEVFSSDLQSNFNTENLKNIDFLKSNTYNIVIIYIDYLKHLQASIPVFEPHVASKKPSLLSRVGSRASSLLRRAKPIESGGNSKSKKIRKLKKYQKL